MIGDGTTKVRPKLLTKDTVPNVPAKNKDEAYRELAVEKSQLECDLFDKEVELVRALAKVSRLKGSGKEYATFASIVRPVAALAGGALLSYSIYTNPALLVNGVNLLLREAATVSLQGLNEMGRGYGVEIAAVLAGLIGGKVSAIAIPPVAFGVLKLASVVSNFLIDTPAWILGKMKEHYIATAVLVLFVVGMYFPPMNEFVTPVLAQVKQEASVYIGKMANRTSL